MRSHTNVRPHKPGIKALRWYQEEFGSEYGIDVYVKDFSEKEYLKLLTPDEKAERKAKNTKEEAEEKAKAEPEPEPEPEEKDEKPEEE